MRLGQHNIAVSNLLLAFAMAAFVVVPLAGALWHGTRPAESNMEKRQLAGLPAWPTSSRMWKKFPKAFDAWAHDQFGFRDDLLKGYTWLMASVFHQSTSYRAFVGRDGWLYFTGDGGLADMQGKGTYTAAELRNDVAQINARGELLAARGIRYGFVVFPDKHTVYPQFLPRGVYAGFDHRRLNALDAAMAQTGHAYYFDASNALRRDAQGSPFQLYYKSDTHWNPWGAYLGYEAWVAASGARLGLRSFEYSFGQFRIPHRSASGDLAKMSGYRPYDPDIYPPAGAGCGRTTPWAVPAAALHRLETIASHMRTADCGGIGTALILHDSFLDSIERYVTSNFKQSRLIWNYPDDRNLGWLVDKLHPDTVLVERVERLMSKFPETDSATLVRELGSVGQSAKLDADDDLLIGNSLNPKARTPDVAEGTIDRTVRDGDRMYIEGWVHTADVPSAVIVGVLNGKVIGEAPVALYRGDVTTSRHDSDLAWSGFRMELPGEALAQDDKALRWYTVNLDSYGTLTLTSGDGRGLKEVATRAAELPEAQVGAVASGDLKLPDGAILKNAGQAKGSLDQIVRDGDFVRLAGWAELERSPASNVIAVMNGRVVGEASVTLRRADVANAQKSPNMMWSGFEMRLPVGMMGRDGKGLRLYFVSSNHFGLYSLRDADQERLRAVLN